MKQHTSSRQFVAFLVVFFSFFLASCDNHDPDKVENDKTSQATSRDMQRSQAGQLSHTPGEPGDYKALIIGINKYQDPNIPELTTAEKDARSMAEVLEQQYGFHKPQLLLNQEANRSSIYNAFHTLSRESVSNDSILIYYAGHGYLDKDLGTGAWIPADASVKDPATYIDNVLVQKFIKSMKAKHVLLISDSCYSGSLFGLTRTLPIQIDEKYYQRAYEDQSRWGLTSGNIEPVADGGKNGHSVFNYFLLKELSNPGKNYFVTHELFSRIAPVVANNSNQRPMCRPLQNVNDEGGQFVFMRRVGVPEKTSDDNYDVSEGQQNQQARFVQAFNNLLLTWDDAALSELSNLAREGYPLASGYLAVVNELGLAGVKKSHKEANLQGRSALEQGLEKEAKSGGAYAQAMLANLYLYGLGCEKDLEKAVIWARKSAEQGNLYAMRKLGWLYENGQGVSQDDKEAVKWYRKAAEQGYANGQYYLGWMYSKNQDYPHDYAEALKWYKKAAEQGNTAALTDLGWMYEGGRGVPQSDKEAVKWYRKAAEQGNSWGQYNLGRMYKDGRGVEKDYKEAMKWYRKAADQGNGDAQFWVGWMYAQGHGVSRSDKEAVKWYKKAAEQENWNGMNYLVRCTGMVEACPRMIRRL